MNVQLYIFHMHCSKQMWNSFGIGVRISVNVVKVLPLRISVLMYIQGKVHWNQLEKGEKECDDIEKVDVVDLVVLGHRCNGLFNFVGNESRHQSEEVERLLKSQMEDSSKKKHILQKYILILILMG